MPIMRSPGDNIRNDNEAGHTRADCQGRDTRASAVSRTCSLTGTTTSRTATAVRLAEAREEIRRWIEHDEIIIERYKFFCQHADREMLVNKYVELRTERPTLCAATHAEALRLIDDEIKRRQLEPAVVRHMLGVT